MSPPCPAARPPTTSPRWARPRPTSAVSCCPTPCSAGNWSKTCSSTDAAELVKVSDLIRKKVLGDIEEQHQSDEQTATGRKLTNQLFDVIKATLAAGRATAAWR